MFRFGQDEVRMLEVVRRDIFFMMNDPFITFFSRTHSVLSFFYQRPSYVPPPKRQRVSVGNDVSIVFSEDNCEH